MKTVVKLYDGSPSSNRWQSADDRVMGGVSVAQLRAQSDETSGFMCLGGQVSLANRGGFVQMKWLLDEPSKPKPGVEGVFIEVRGNGEAYNLHLRTTQLWLPWQSFRYTFKTTPNWQMLYVPFVAFEAYKSSASLDPLQLRSLAVVAIGRAFAADVCVSQMGFYCGQEGQE